MSKKGVIITSIILGVGIIAGIIVLVVVLTNRNSVSTNDPLKTYKDSAIETLEDYRVAKISYKEASNKLDSLSDRLKNIDGDEDTQLDARSLSSTLKTISLRLSYSSIKGEPTAKDIDEWIKKIKSIE